MESISCENEELECDGVSDSSECAERYSLASSSRQSLVDAEEVGACFCKVRFEDTQPLRSGSQQVVVAKEAGGVRGCRLGSPSRALEQAFVEMCSTISTRSGCTTTAGAALFSPRSSWLLDEAPFAAMSLIGMPRVLANMGLASLSARCNLRTYSVTSVRNTAVLDFSL